MKISSGVDIIEIDRIKKSLSSPRFVNRLFGISEQKQYRERGERPQFLAGNFCAKEAFSKAIGTGIRGFAPSEVEILRDGLGKPYFVFSGRAKKIVEELGLSFDVSISHDKSRAIAFVVAWENVE